MLGIWHFFGTQIDGDNFVKVLPNATVTVKRESDGALASLETDVDSSSPGLDNPFTSGDDGEIAFAADISQRYRIDIVSGEVSLTLRNQSVSAPPIKTVGAAVVASETEAEGQAALGLGTAAVQDVGTEIGNVVQLEGAPDSPAEAALPAVNGSQLTDLPASSTTQSGTVEKATQAEMEAETADKNVTADNAKYHPGVAKAWVRFDGAGAVAIDDSYNVDSITDQGTGDYDVNFSNNMADANYVAVTNAFQETRPGGSVYWAQTVDHAVGSVTIFVNSADLAGASNAAADLSIVQVAVYGDLA